MKPTTLVVQEWELIKKSSSRRWELKENMTYEFNLLYAMTYLKSI